MAQKQIQIKYSDSNTRHVHMAEMIAGRPDGMSVADYISDALEAMTAQPGDDLRKVTQERDQLKDEVERLRSSGDGYDAEYVKQLEYENRDMKERSIRQAEHENKLMEYINQLTDMLNGK